LGNGVAYFKAWVVFAIVQGLLGMFCGAIAGGITGAVLLGLGFDLNQRQLQFAGGIAGFLVGLPISFLVFKWAVEKFIVVKLLPPPLNQNLQGIESAR